MTELKSALQVKVAWMPPRCRQMMLDVRAEIPGYRERRDQVVTSYDTSVMQVQSRSPSSLTPISAAAHAVDGQQRV